MSNFFKLTLDTTPPIVDIYAPNYVINGYYLEFRASINEPVDEGKKEAYAVDNGGNVFPIILEYDKENNEFIGLVDTFGFENGIAKIVVKLFDEVHNMGIAEKAFKVLQNIGDIKITSRTMGINYCYKIKPIIINTQLMMIKSSEMKHKTNIKIKKKNIKIKLKEGDCDDRN